MIDRGLHHLGALQHLRDDQLIGREETTHFAHALHELRNGADLSESVDKITGDPVYYPLGEGGYSVVYDPEGSMITCTGLVHETKKTLQLQYNVF